MSPTHTSARCQDRQARPGGYATREPHKSDLYRLLLDNAETFLAHHEQRFQPEYGYLRPEVQSTLEELIACGDFRFGLARVKCRDCGDEMFIPLSCRRRGCCASCAAKRQLIFTERVLEEVLPDVPCRQWTFSLPKALRVSFRYDGVLSKELSQIVVREVTRYVRAVTGHPDLAPGFVVVDQTFGTLPDSYHPHEHICATDGGFTPAGVFVPLPRVRKKDVAAICEVLRHRVLSWLVRREKISEDFADCMLAWENSGFSLDASRRIRKGRRERLEVLLNYMARHPFNPKGIHYNAHRGTVSYRAPRVHGTRKTDTIEADAVDFIAMLAQHIPHRRRHQFRYYCAANPKVRKRLDLCGLPVETEMPEVTAARGRKSWARLIWKLFGVDPLVCKKCGGQREILAIIFDRESINRILVHLDLPTELPAHKPARGPPEPPPVKAGARTQPSPAAEENDSQLFMDPDNSEWDCIDEPFETDDEVAADTCQDVPQTALADEQMMPNSLLEVMERWSGILCRADELSEEKEATN